MGRWTADSIVIDPLGKQEALHAALCTDEYRLDVASSGAERLRERQRRHEMPACPPPASTTLTNAPDSLRGDSRY